MTTKRISSVLALLLVLTVSASPAWAVSKEIVQLQVQVQALQDQMSRMQQSFDERMGVMNHLVEQNTDTVNKVGNAVAAVQTSLGKV
ncbi:MAG TPA: hypothetical protein VKG87_09610, partial [Terriglobales bacterium]|nr:hypothetical protein [Terriglobales bacterium]